MAGIRRAVFEMVRAVPSWLLLGIAGSEGLHSRPHRQTMQVSEAGPIVAIDATFLGSEIFSRGDESQQELDSTEATVGALQQQPLVSDPQPSVSQALNS